MVEYDWLTFGRSFARRNILLPELVDDLLRCFWCHIDECISVLTTLCVSIALNTLRAAFE